MQIVESCVERVRKPDPKIFHTLLSRCGHSAARTIFCDDIAANLKTAKGLGLTTILVRNPFPGTAAFTTDRYKGVGALNELSALIGVDVLADFRSKHPDVPPLSSVSAAAGAAGAAAASDAAPRSKL